MNHNCKLATLLAAVVLVVAGCSADAPSATVPDDVAPDPGQTNLKATSSRPTVIELTWHVTEPSAAGQVIEYAASPSGQFSVLKYLPPTATSYVHEDLAPRMTFTYRVRPYVGTASGSVELTLPPGESKGDPADDEEWMKPRTVPGPEARATVRDPAGPPTGFTVKMMHANGVKFSWTDRTTDEDGFFLEIKQTGAPDFIVGAALDPDVNTFGLETLPSEKKATYRVRPYKFGESTNIVQQTTGSW